jgi:hypothetical protein
MITDKAIECISLIELSLLQATEYYDQGDYTRSADCAWHIADAAEKACASADGMSDCIRSAKNARPDAYKVWERIAEHAARLVNAAEKLRGDCIIQQDLAGS